MRQSWPRVKPQKPVGGRPAATARPPNPQGRGIERLLPPVRIPKLARVLIPAWKRGSRRAALAYVAGQAVEIPEDELNEAVRRALVVRAVGGSPQRELSLAEEAVVRLAEELDGAERRRALEQGLESLRVHVRERPAVTASLDQLLADSDLAWRCFAAAQVATELG